MYAWSYKERLAGEIVRKAEGVFLWADIASRALQRGMTNNDTYSQIYERLEIMPKEMSSLFYSMWERQGDDREIYGREAALCFNLVLEWEKWQKTEIKPPCRNPQLFESDGSKCIEEIYRVSSYFTLYLLMLSKQNSSRGLDRPQNTASKNELIPRYFRELYKKLPILSAGLLEFSRPLWMAEDKNADPDIEVRFIHRTAKEFLMESVEGREILRLDTSHFEQRFRVINRTIRSRGLTVFSPTESELCYLPKARVAIKHVIMKLCNIEMQDTVMTREIAGRKVLHEELVAWQKFHNHEAPKFPTADHRSTFLD